jgi:hypothetical protein
MNVWAWTFLLSNVLYWGLFIRSAIFGRARRIAVVIGVVHMLFASTVSVAPIRSLFDPGYVGFALGVLRFEGRAATLPSALVLAGSLVSASLLTSRTSGRQLLFVAIFDFLFAIDTAAGTVMHGDYRIQFGDALTIDGLIGLGVMLLLFAGAPLVSAGWTWRHQNSAA